MKKVIFAASLALGVVACGGGGDSGQVIKSGSLSSEALRAKPIAPAALAPQAISKVNSSTAGQQAARAVGALADGGYTVAWVSDNTTLFIQRYDSAGSKVDGEILVPLSVQHSDPATAQRAVVQSSVAVLSDGGVVVAYQLDTEVPGLPGAEFRTFDQGVYIQRFDTNGTQVLPQTVVFSRVEPMSVQPRFLRAATVTALADGGFVVAWLNVPQTSTPRATLFKQRFDSQSRPVGGTVLVEDYLPGCNGAPCDVRNSYTLVADAQGGYTVSVFHSVFPTTFISVTHFDAADSARQIVPARAGGVLVLPLEGDRFVLFTSDSTASFRRFLDSTGNPAGDASPTPSLPFAARELVDGSFVVFWNVAGTITAQRFDSTGEPISALPSLGTNLLDLRIAALANSGFALAWSAPGTVIDLDIFTQRFIEVLGRDQAALRAKRKACLIQAKGMTGQDRKAFMATCTATGSHARQGNH